MKLTTFKQAEEYLNQFITKTNKWGEPSFAHARTKYFMKLLGDPQNKLKVIHIAGTSGKGSTSYLTSAALLSQNLKVGMGTSPHIYNILERIQINLQPISESMFVKYIHEIQPFIEETRKSEFGTVTYFEIIVGLTYYIFQKEQVDVAVMEVGLGGEFDATNTITSENKISVITRIGYDHMEFLGNTLPEIAYAKAKIIQPKNLVIKLQQEKEVMDVVEREAENQQGKLIKVHPSQLLSETSSSLLGLKCDFHYQNITFNQLHIPLIAEYQFENISVALVTFIEFMKREKKEIDQHKLKSELKELHIPGRMEMIQYKKRELIIDGAHNPQKMEAFIKSLMHIYKDERFTFLLSFKKGKDYEPILRFVLPFAESIIITSFDNTNQGMGQLYSEDPNVIAEILKKMNYGYFEVIPELQKALDKTLESKKMIVVTGSLYLIGEVYNLIS